MTHSHRKRLLLTIVLLGGFCGTARADYGRGDSSMFALDVSTTWCGTSGWGDSNALALDLSTTWYDTTGSGDSNSFVLNLSVTWYPSRGSADSGAFALDTVGVRRAWGISNTFEIRCVDDAECDDADVCTFDECEAGACVFSANTYGDIDGNGFITLFDLFCVLDGFEGDFTNCTFEQDDIHGTGNPVPCVPPAAAPCCPNGVINLFDLFAVLNAFAGIDPCCGG